MQLFEREGAYLLCPHCAYPLSVEVVAAREEAVAAQSTVAVRCNTCNLDLLNAQPVPCTMREVECRTHLSCLFCGVLRPAVATICATCKRWQNPDTGRERQLSDDEGSVRLRWSRN